MDRSIQQEEFKQQIKQLDRSLAMLAVNVVFVEGKRDKLAVQKLGGRNIHAISGRLAAVCESLADEAENISKVVVLTDLDRRGNELVEQACDELARYSIKCDRQQRLIFGKILRIKYFETLDRAYEKFVENKGDKINRRGVLNG